VFAYLAAQNGRAVPRDELAEILWGDELPATWEKALRVLMTKLRALLEECGIDGSTALTSAFGCYKLTLPDGAWIDVDAAEEAADQAEAALTGGDLAEAHSQATVAAALARRSFLPGEDGSWVEGRRRDLRDVLVRSLECLREAAFGAGKFAEAARHAEEVIALEPFRESGYRRLMQAQTAAGNPAEALRVYERCRHFLAEELGAYPSPETEAAYVEILHSKRASAVQDDVPVGQADAPVRRDWRKALVFGALVIAGVVGAAAFLLVREDGGGASPLAVGGSAVAVFDAGSGASRDVVEAPVPPTAMAAGLGYVWAASADSNTVVVIDPTTNTVRDTIPVESAPGGIAIGGGWVWVTNSLTGTVSQISPETLSVVQTIRVGNGPSGIAAGNGYVWVANTSDHTISKLRASDGKRLATDAAVSDPGALALGEGAVWVASKLAAVVVKLSPSSGEVLDRIPVGDGPAAVGVGAGSVWVASSLSGTVSRLDPDTGDVRATVEIGSSADALAVVRGDVWVASGLQGTVSRIDARDGGVTTIDVEERPTALATVKDSIYVGFRPSGASHVGGTLRLLAESPAPQQLDPANAYTPEVWTTLALTNDGLVGWRRVGGQAGTELVPDLAVSLPSVSRDGQRYTFQLRRGIRYSDGRLLKARDVRYSLERLYKLKPKTEPAAADPYQAIVGADRCSKRPSRCDLSRGIVTDDEAGAVTFRLVRSDPEFLFRLALPFAYVVPAGTPLRSAVHHPVPATGPYRVASVSRHGSMRLVRNPYFREWSTAAQPAGFADEIVSRPLAGRAQPVQLVAQGKADYTSADVGERLTVPPVHRPQLHVQPLPMTFYLVVDTRRPPFDDARARRAVNLAVDRNKFLRLGGGTSAARPTCQVLPPNFPGYEPYCPYTLDPRAGSGWTAPDPVEAQRLITASGTAGTKVELWWTRDFGERAGRYLKEVFDSLGFRARLRLVPGDLGPYFSAVTRRGASWHLAGTGWFADSPAASNFMNLLSCSSNDNWGRFCDEAIDGKIRRALELQERDPAAANRSWAALDRGLTDLAPWIFLYTPYSEVFVSKRVGNYQHHPLLGVLFAQIWVR
jgi:peptide/nickel transport system substrate-binding protein